MIKVAAFTGGYDVPSSRLRVRQYIEELRQYDVDMTEYISISGAYPPEMKLKRPIWAIKSLVERVPDICASFRHDIVLLQRELISRYVTMEILTKRPRVLDVDDAIWLNCAHKDKAKLVKICDGVICGNETIANYYSKYTSNICIIPTAVDTDIYRESEYTQDAIIGWTGTSSSFKYIYSIEASIFELMRLRPNLRLRIISDKLPKFRLIDRNRIEFVKWSPSTEIESLQGISIGIMPLENTLWEKAKCSYKMLVYMSCGKPVVVSPVGMNNEVLARGNLGYAASNKDDWIDAILYILDNPYMGKIMGKVGREVVKKYYSKKKVLPIYAAALKKYL